MCIIISRQKILLCYTHYINLSLSNKKKTLCYFLFKCARTAATYKEKTKRVVYLRMNSLICYYRLVFNTVIQNNLI